MRLPLPVAVAAAIVVLFVAAALAAPVLAPWDPTAGALGFRLRPPAWIGNGSTRNLLGTDALGRDLLSRLLHGARISLMVSLAAILVAGSVGTAVGVIAGYVGGWTDRILMRIVDLALSIPVILLALLFGVLFGPSFGNVILVIALVLWSQYARMARGETMRIVREEYVDLARTSGLSDLQIVGRHVLPNIAGVIIVVATLQVGTVVILEASLSFLGVGVPPPTPSWGTMVSDGRSYLTTAWWLCLFPGVAIMLVVMSVNVLGDWLTERLNPAIGRQDGP